MLLHLTPGTRLTDRQVNELGHWNAWAEGTYAERSTIKRLQLPNWLKDSHYLRDGVLVSELWFNLSDEAYAKVMEPAVNAAGEVSL
jgi:hypothetical protein